MKIDKRFSDPDAEPTPWSDTARVLEQAELYWLTTVRADGRPHVTPLIGLAVDSTVFFCTGPDEQKAKNLEHSAQLALTTGNNAWAAGLDVVVEGTAVRVTDPADLRRLADAYVAKYGEVWRFGVGDEVFGTDGHIAPSSGSSRPRSSRSRRTRTDRPRTASERRRNGGHRGVGARGARRRRPP